MFTQSFWFSLGTGKTVKHLVKETMQACGKDSRKAEAWGDAAETLTHFLSAFATAPPTADAPGGLMSIGYVAIKGVKMYRNREDFRRSGQKLLPNRTHLKALA